MKFKKNNLHLEILHDEIFIAACFIRIRGIITTKKASKMEFSLY